MSDVELVHPVPSEEVVAWTGAMMTTFLGDTAESRVWAEWRREHGWDPDRAWGARDRGRWVATLRTIDTSLTVPGGGEVRADALTNVTVAATHRRQGLLSTMLSASLADARRRGDAVSVLLAAEYAIYGRFGYAPASIGAYYTVYPRRRGGGLRTAVPAHVRQVDADELRTLAPRIFAAARLARAGNIERPPYRWDVALRTNGYPEPQKPTETMLVHEGPGGADGFVRWTSGGDWDDTVPGGEVTVVDLWAATDDAYVGLWQYLLSLDVVEKIHIRTRPVDEALRWLLVDGRALQQTYAGDHLWLRLLDVPAALSARTYATDERLVFDVVDDDIGASAGGTFVLEGGVCAPSREAPELRVHQRALAATYLGGFSLQRQVIAGLVQELGVGALRRADALFATPLAPWCGTDF